MLPFGVTTREAGLAAVAATVAAAVTWLVARNRGAEAARIARSKLRVRHLKTHAYKPPAWAAGLKNIPQSRVVLCQLPTPLYQWENFPVPPAAEGSVEVWVKRDDETGSAVSGNKIRKLEFILAEAMRLGFRSVITGGKVQSNHARSTAVAARMLGLDCVLALRTKDHKTLPGLEGNLLMNYMARAEIHMVSDAYYESPGVGGGVVLRQVADKVAARTGARPYVIPIGGSDRLGIWGYIDMIEEIRLQMAELGAQPFDELVAAIGSCGTVAGIALGCHLTGVARRVRAFTACDTPAVFYKDINALYGELGFTALRAEDMVEIVDSTGAGYHVSTSEELEDIYQVAARTGVFTDPVYSGKALHAWLGRLAAEGAGAGGRKKRVLFVHTGGMMGLYTKLDQLAAVPHATAASGTMVDSTVLGSIPSQ